MASVPGTTPSQASRATPAAASRSPSRVVIKATGSRHSMASGQPASSTSRQAPDSGWMMGMRARKSAPHINGSTAAQASHGQGGPAAPTARHGRSTPASARATTTSTISMGSKVIGPC